MKTVSSFRLITTVPCTLVHPPPSPKSNFIKNTTRPTPGEYFISVSRMWNLKGWIGRIVWIGEIKIIFGDIEGRTFDAIGSDRGC